MQTRFHRETSLPEQAGYFTVPGADLYAVLHPVTDPVARVLLVGPFASERPPSYHAWVRWARYLAVRRIEVLRFDYRGIGESTGVFEEMSFENWSEDVQLLANRVAGRSPSAPLVLHGLQLGAILAAKCFHEGTGDALLLWYPPANANQVLRSSLLRWAGFERRDKSPESRRTIAECVHQLEQGHSIEVQGYQWSSRLWRDSFHFEMPATLGDEIASFEEYKRPVKIVRPSNEAGPLIESHFWYNEIQDLSSLYSCNCDWVAEALILPNRRDL